MCFICNKKRKSSFISPNILASAFVYSVSGESPVIRKWLGLFTRLPVHMAAFYIFKYT